MNNLTADEIEWCEPPPRRPPPQRGRAGQFVDLLKERPGQWAVYPHPVSPVSVRANAIRNPQRHPGTEWEYYDGVLYGRWVGVP